MATQSNAPERAQYRSKNARLKAATQAAMRMLRIYSWNDSDGVVQFANSPVGDETQLEVLQQWSALRAACILAGELDGDNQAGHLAGDAQFLRVESYDGGAPVGWPEPFVWRKRAVFEVLMGVNSYGYADGAALDIFYDGLKSTAVRVQRLTVPFLERESFISGNMNVVTAWQVVGQINPFEAPNLASGWGVIGDVTGNPEPDYFGLQSGRIVIIPTGLEGPRGPQGLDAYQVALQDGFYGTRAEWLDSLLGGPMGPQGERGLRGFPGASGNAQPLVITDSVVPQDSDNFVAMREVTVTMANTGVWGAFVHVGLRFSGGDATEGGVQDAISALAAYIIQNPIDWDFERPLTTPSVENVLYLFNVATGEVVALYSQSSGMILPGSGLPLARYWLKGADGGTQLRAGTDEPTNDGAFEVLQAIAVSDVFSYLNNTYSIIEYETNFQYATDENAFLDIASFQVLPF